AEVHVGQAGVGVGGRADEDEQARLLAGLVVADGDGDAAEAGAGGGDAEGQVAERDVLVAALDALPGQALVGAAVDAGGVVGDAGRVVDQVDVADADVED